MTSSDQRIPINFSKPLGTGSVSGLGGRNWVWSTSRKIWEIADLGAVVFEGGAAINVDRGNSGAGSVETSFDMDKVNIAPDITEENP